MTDHVINAEVSTSIPPEFLEKIGGILLSTAISEEASALNIKIVKVEPK